MFESLKNTREPIREIEHIALKNQTQRVEALKRESAEPIFENIEQRMARGDYGDVLPKKPESFDSGWSGTGGESTPDLPRPQSPRGSGAKALVLERPATSARVVEPQVIEAPKRQAGAVAVLDAVPVVDPVRPQPRRVTPKPQRRRAPIERVVEVEPLPVREVELAPAARPAEKPIVKPLQEVPVPLRVEAPQKNVKPQAIEAEAQIKPIPVAEVHAHSQSSTALDPRTFPMLQPQPEMSCLQPAATATQEAGKRKRDWMFDLASEWRFWPYKKPEDMKFFLDPFEDLAEPARKPWNIKGKKKEEWEDEDTLELNRRVRRRRRSSTDSPARPAPSSTALNSQVSLSIADQGEEEEEKEIVEVLDLVHGGKEITITGVGEG